MMGTFTSGTSKMCRCTPTCGPLSKNLGALIDFIPSLENNFYLFCCLSNALMTGIVVLDAFENHKSIKTLSEVIKVNPKRM